MTERTERRLFRSTDSLAIGNSSLAWDSNGLTITIDEVTAPFPSRVRGVVRVHPIAMSSFSTVLDGAGHHRWGPIVPLARVEVLLEQPALRWSGIGYLDSNEGDVPLEQSFSGWHWSRATLGRSTTVLYDVCERDCEPGSLALRFEPSGSVEALEPPPPRRLPDTRWRIRRETRADQGAEPQVARTLEDGPFYARSLLSTRLFGENVAAMHESLSLDRFSAPWVRMLLPFRMPRVRS